MSGQLSDRFDEGRDREFGHRLGGRSGERPEAAFDFGGVDERRFLERIRARMNKGVPKSPHPGSSIWPAGHEEKVSHSEKVELFTLALEKVGGRVLRAATCAEAYTLVARELAKVNARRALLANGAWPGLEEALASAGVAFDRWGDLDFSHGSKDRAPEVVNAWDAGITWADYAVADLGSVALLFDRDQGRSVSLVPPRYVALVRRDALVLTRRTVLERVSRVFRERGRVGALVFVTGPSRSADIEMDLSIGVHGPGEMWAVLIDE